MALKKNLLVRSVLVKIVQKKKTQKLSKKIKVYIKFLDKMINTTYYRINKW